MGIGRKLVNKMKRRKKSLNPNRGLRRQDKIDKKDEVLSDSPGAYKYLRGIQRRLDKAFGQQQLPSPEKASKEDLISGDLERVDFDAGPGVDNGIQLTMSAAHLALVGLRPGDLVKVLTGVLKGKTLKVVSVISSTELRLEDDAALAAPEAGAKMKAQASGTKASYK